ncbi:MAG: chromosome segregation protein [Candidatus Azotimanducaceae bacterium]|jgi:chromosome segregation protein
MPIDWPVERLTAWQCRPSLQILTLQIPTLLNPRQQCLVLSTVLLGVGMRLKQIKLAGFKSFVDPTTVNLPGERCAVVGPNGCGKSNIIDAVRWVMGESSAKQLRGENLTDVIFSGSSSRKPTAAASVELLFDNSDGRIGGEYSAYAEIALRRQVSRDGQSNYYLNGSKCRRRDIQDIFLGTGFGPRSYSIIEQGMISQLVEAKPEELRVYLEEAAGISKYKERRRETENRIRHTRENLERINDIREELGRQLDRLQRQSQAAEKYRELRTSESLLTAQLYTLRQTGLKAELEKHEQSITALELELEKAIAEQRRLEAEIETSRALYGESSDQFNTVQGEFYQLGADIARIEETIQFNQSRVQQLRQDLQSVGQRRSETERQLAMDEQQIAELQEKIGALLPEVLHLAEVDKKAQEDLAEQEGVARSVLDAWDEFNQHASRNERQAEVQASRIEHLDQLLQRLRRRQSELLSMDSQQPQSGAAQMDLLAEEISELESESNLLDIKINECLQELAAAREDILLRDQVLEEARGEVQNLRHELASLQAVQDAALGDHDKEAAEWIDQNHLRGNKRLGDSLAVVAGWELAVETVLGKLLSALVVDDLAQLAGSLSELPEGGLALIEARPAEPLPNVQLSLPTLDSLVRSDSERTGSLLFGVFAAESTDVALGKRHQLRAGESIITRDGFWLGPDWVRVLFNNDLQSGIIERGLAIETLSLRTEEAERTLGELQNHVQEGRERVERLEAEREELQQTVNTLNQSLGQRRTHHGVTQVKIEEADARRIQVEREAEDIASQIAQESTRLDAARTELAHLEKTREQQRDEREELSQQREQLDERLMHVREAARHSRDNFHELNGQKDAIQTRLAASETARDRLLSQMSELEKQKEALSAGISTSETPMPELQQELDAKLAERVAVEQKLGDIRQAMETAEAQTRKYEGDRGQQEQNVNGVREQLEAGRVERQGLSVQEANVLEQLQATGHELEAVRAELPEDADEQKWAEELERMARRIQRLGPINLAAIEEYEQERERKEYLDAQALDLESALTTLTEAIHKIDKETRSRFKDTFEAVNTRLGELFPKVFGGGHAYLELTGEDLLDTGVSLMARPPGKRNASVHLLSGGEKAMTAIALIFAIFHLNPSPVCLLDEVDAPLDDANVSRFAALIKEMSEEVQFLVITHNKITMEMADFLMGVTMQEPGVSRLVSVDVDEAAAMAVS